jgi:competence protein ComEC
MLVDGGGSAVGAFDVGENVVAPFLWNKGLKRLNYLVLTHAHPDHLNGLEAVARDFPVAEFWRTAGPPPPDGRYMKMEAALAKARTRLVARGDDLRRDGITIEILSPRAGLPDAGADENDRSLVLRVRYGRTAVLLAGDIGAAAEEEILAAGLDVRSQALKAPHHGSESSSSPAFLDAVGPEVIVISVGRGNSYSLPGPAVLERYRESGARVFRTDLNGAVEIRSDGRSLRLRTSE